MREHIRLGRIAGVAVGINWSVLVVFALITFGLATGRFPVRFPGLDTVAYVVAGLAAGVVFFLSLLAHEVSHAVVARRNGVEVEGITLWLFGGVARLQGEPSTPRADLQIAGVGPLVSLILAGVFGALAAGLSALNLPGLVVDAFVWLAVINLMLAVFNLIPAAPLDGGRILRAILWQRRGDRTRAAITASRAGRGFGWFLVAIGLLELLFLPGFGGIWLMLIGWFLTNAAAAEEQQAKLSDELAGVRVRDVMSTEPTTAPASIPVDKFIDEYVFPNRYSTFPLTDNGGEPAGLVTLNRVKHVPADQRATTVVRDVACPLEDVPVVGPDEPVAELIPRMAGCADGRALVVDDGHIVGLVSPTDVMRRMEIAQLRGPRQDQHI
jgi:Zn-dependent protease/CBS domain-containing protein